MAAGALPFAAWGSGRGRLGAVADPLVPNSCPTHSTYRPVVPGSAHWWLDLVLSLLFAADYAHRTLVRACEDSGGTVTRSECSRGVTAACTLPCHTHTATDGVASPAAGCPPPARAYRPAVVCPLPAGRARAEHEHAHPLGPGPALVPGVQVRGRAQRARAPGWQCRTSRTRVRGTACGRSRLLLRCAGRCGCCGGPCCQATCRP